MTSEDDDFRNRKANLIIENFAFLVGMGYIPKIEIGEYSVKVVYSNLGLDRKVVLLHDLTEKHFYFKIIKGVHHKEHSDFPDSSIKHFIEVFMHYNPLVKFSDIQPGLYEKSEDKLIVNAQLLKELGTDVLKGGWF